MKTPLLSVVIPTFNRAPLLKLLLESVARDLPTWPDDIELLVLDNASTDHTHDVVLGIEARGIPIKFFRNHENVGMDRNLAACFGQASGKYFWQIGDDDLLFEGALNLVLSICREHDFGILHLSAASFHDGQQDEMFLRRIPAHQSLRELDSAAFFRSVNVFLTFISANVVNKEAVLKWSPDFDPNADLHSYLPQLAWIYGALKACDRHLLIPEQMFAALAGNTGGYRLIEVFGFNLTRITERHLKIAIPNATRIMSNASLTRVIANEIRSMRVDGRHLNKFSDENVASALTRCFGKSFYYRAFVKPIAFLPRASSSLFFLFLRAFNRLNRHLGYRLL